jgi:RNA polymerase-binding transcription factor DksA
MKDTKKYKKLLDEEKKKLIKELETVGRKNPKVAGGWEAVATDLDSDSADENEVADEQEEYKSNEGIVGKLEIQLQNVEKALGKIGDGSYGICDVCGEEIPEERLRANSSAVTCLKHTK